ncbi:helix-turn-helix domain-containing protein [Saccharibacillus sp. CPCC 101409]|uniref:TetR/AcrR family transcriptional regulator n=1 Tax=Saccharibacillus sp. CPCC 101409 TaxID=3058041 RepID=UPI0026727761|nr:TetR/AcrR family transcriptional regulator [Saccharibacillus sp. CPCC 101409]MDO3408947.1 helix-turn-helix domain-containing protein [Saccharibacillus sp. CPCC 101409]
MSIIKQNIMDSAIRFFTEKGYLATSIQDIADDCGIAKGSFYKFFSSKEDLFLEVHRAKQESFFESMEDIHLEPGLTAKEIFIRETKHQFDFFLENRFVVVSTLEMQTSEGEIAANFARLRANFLNMNKTLLIRRFKSEIESGVWDLVLMYHGIIQEYLFLLTVDKRHLNIRDLSVFIVERMEDMVSGVLTKKPQSIIQKPMMDDYVEAASQGKSASLAEIRHELFATLFSILKELVITNHHRTELQEALTLLKEELEKDEPKVVLIRAMLQFLMKEHELRDIIEKLNKIGCYQD